MLSEFSDESLMLLYGEGGSGAIDAFKELYSRHSRGLYMFISWRSPRAEWVDEIVQETWGSLHHTRGRYAPQSTFRTFLFQIARNKLIDQLRLQKKVVLASELGQFEDGTEIFDEVANASYESINAEDMMSSKQRLEWLSAAIKALPSEQREVLALQHFSGMSLNEIAQLTSSPVETIKSRLRYAMQKLRQQAQPLLAQGDLA